MTNDAPMEWQPIETVPRDRPFLAYENGDMYKAQFCGDEDGKLYFYSSCGQPVVESPEPTHWMPLPPPPQTKGQDDETA